MIQAGTARMYLNFGRFALVAALVLIAACAKDNKDLAPCPEAKVLMEPSSLTRFAPGPGRDPTDILFEASFRRVAGDCGYRAKGGKISIDLTVVIDIERGAGNRDAAAAFRYFVAVAHAAPEKGADPLVIDRRSFPVSVDFTGGLTMLRFTDTLDLAIPRPDDRDVRKYVLLLGMELSEEELRYNKSHGPR